MKIQIFVTGGTFDKEYNEIKGELYFNKTHLPEMLKLGRSKVDVKIKTLMMKDSLDLTDNDRDIIVENCKKSKENKIIITHGTDTIVKTAKAIAKQVPGKTIILTGAMVPYKFGSSDGLFNLGSSLAFIQTLKPNIYIVMNGRYYFWNNVRKNRVAGEFEQIK